MANRYWVAGSGVWSAAASHWASVSGGAPSAANIPGSGDVAIFDTSSGSGICTLDQIVVISGLTIATSASMTVDTSASNWSIVLSGALSVQGGVLRCRNATIGVGTNCLIADVSGVIQAETSTISMTGTGNLSNPNFNNSLYVLTSSTGSVITCTSNVRVRYGSVSLGAGTFNLSTFTLFVRDASIHTGSATVTGSEIICEGTSTISSITANSTQVVISTGTSTVFGNISCSSLFITSVLNFSSTYTMTIQNTLQLGTTYDSGISASLSAASAVINVLGSFDIYSASSGTTTLNLGTSSFNVKGNFYIDTATRTTVTQGTSTVTLNGTTGTQQITLRGKSLYNLTMNNSGSTMQLMDALTLTGNFLRTQGIIRLNGFNITCVNFTINNGSTTTFYTVGSHTLNSRTITCSGNCSLNGQAANLLNMNATVTCTMAVTGSLTASYVNLAFNTASVSAGTATNSTLSNTVNWNTTTKYWINGTGNFNDTNHWSSSSGGSGGASVPSTGDTAVFDSASGSGTCSLTGSVSIVSITISTGSSITLDTTTSNYNITLSGSLTVQAGNLRARASTISIATHCLISNVSSIFTRDTSTISMTGTGNLSNPNFDSSFYSLSIGAGSVITFTGAVRTRSGTVAFNNTSTVNFGINPLYLKEGSIFTTTSATLNCTAGSSFIVSEADSTLGGLTCAGGWIDLLIGSVNVSGNISCANLMIVGGVINTNNYSITLTEGLVIGPTYESHTNCDFVCGSSIITTHDVTIYNATASNTVTFDMASCTIFISGDWYLDTITRMFMTQGTSTVTFNATTGTQYITSRGQSFYNLTMSNSGATLQLLDALLLTGDFLRIQGIIRLNGFNVSCRNFTINNGSTTTFYSTGSHTLNGRTITCSGSCALNGQVGNLLNMNASVNCNMDVTGTLTANYTRLAYNTATDTPGYYANSTVESAVFNWFDHPIIDDVDHAIKRGISRGISVGIENR